LIVHQSRAAAAILENDAAAAAATKLDTWQEVILQIASKLG
jgi:hypothetical protein